MGSFNLRCQGVWLAHNRGVQTQFDTIIAPITASGGAVCIVRLSGPDAWDISRVLMVKPPIAPESHRAHFRSFLNGDDGLVIFFADGKSFTGESSVEFNLHGSPASVRKFVELALAHGARMARPGEFTERAFLNGKLDLSQAEGVNDTVRAITSRQLDLAEGLRSGSLFTTLTRMEHEIIGHLATLEATIDFSEEIGDLDPKPILQSLGLICSEVNHLVENSKHGRVIREGLRIAIVGPPNAGKSSLLNRLLGVNRAIVTDVAGTTRDYVEETIELGGLQCVLIDTAGLRETMDPVESFGIQLSHAQAAKADLVWFVTDARETVLVPKFDRPTWHVANKSDLLPGSMVGDYQISTYTGEGLDKFILALGNFAPDLSGLVPNSRHQTHLQSVAESLENAVSCLDHSVPPDLIITHLRSAVHDIGQITGSTASADLLDRIFSQFCIGK
jgi:tRNA modification GTPase